MPESPAQPLPKPESDYEQHPILRKLRDSSIPAANLIGVLPGPISHGRAIMELQTGPQHTNPMGTVHGGILCDLADSAMGIAFATTLDHSHTFTTLEIKINFLRPVWNSRLRAEGRVTAKGQTIGLVECEVRNEEGKLVAKASSTCMVLKGDQARGR
jgi:uncharacterized protein (TIGR00369 family)